MFPEFDFFIVIISIITDISTLGTAWDSGFFKNAKPYNQLEILANKSLNSPSFQWELSVREIAPLSCIFRDNEQPQEEDPVELLARRWDPWDRAAGAVTEEVLKGECAKRIPSQFWNKWPP